MNILVTSDNHLGFKKRNPNWSEDAFHAFTEHMNFALVKEVDLVFFLGDVFDKKEPRIGVLEKSRVILEKTIHKKNYNFMEARDRLNDIDWEQLEKNRAAYLKSKLKIIDLEKKEEYLQQKKGVLALGYKFQRQKQKHQDLIRRLETKLIF